MNSQKILRDERGYTLVETVVAMAIFLSVLLPLITTMGSLMFEKKTVILCRALSLAVTEMNLISNAKDFTERRKQLSEGLVLERSVKSSGINTEVNVVVKSVSSGNKEIISLKRIFVAHL